MMMMSGGLREIRRFVLGKTNPNAMVWIGGTVPFSTRNFAERVSGYPTRAAKSIGYSAANRLPLEFLPLIGHHLMNAATLCGVGYPARRRMARFWSASRTAVIHF